MSHLGVFALWVEEKELAGRADARAVAQELSVVARRVAGDAGVETGSRVLDLGSGTGALAFAAADLGARVVAVDVDAGALRRGRGLARSLSVPVEHLAADARALPLRDASFDASIHRSVFAYMEERERAVAEERRVLRPGGRVSCSESLGSELDLETEDRGIARVWEGGLRDILLDTPDALTLSGGDLEDLYAQGGFHAVSLTSIPHRVTLDSADAVARALIVAPPRGLSARERWLRSGIPAPLLDEFMARLVAEADRGRPASLIAAEGFLIATA